MPCRRMTFDGRAAWQETEDAAAQTGVPRRSAEPAKCRHAQHRDAGEKRATQASVPPALRYAACSRVNSFSWWVGKEIRPWHRLCGEKGILSNARTDQRGV